MTVQNTVKLGGTASDVTVAKIAHGLMMMTWLKKDGDTTLSDEVGFASIKAGCDQLPPGVRMLINGGEFYGPNCSPANLEFLARFFTKYPEYVDKTFLSIKGGLKARSFTPDSSPENLKRSVDLVNTTLRGTKKVDLFECARVDPDVAVEDAIRTLAGFVKEGKISHIGMSECSATSLRRGNSVHPISIVEIEVSPWSYEEETRKVIATAQELGITVAAYSPLGRGFFTGAIKSVDDFPDNDRRRGLSRFQEENLRHNLALAEALRTIAERKQITPAQLSLAWVASLGPHVIPLPGSSHKKRTLENLAAADIALTDAEIAEIAEILDKHTVKGGRYVDVDPKVLHLWG
ncbi:aldo/keto reductase [Amylocystis lapponica]|nr:aldo/keto reductase [Amylocystis lapponica]